MIFRPLNDNDFQMLLNSEHEAFPTSGETAFANNDEKLNIYKGWISDLNLSLVAEEEGQIKGLISVVPINQKGWDFIHDKNQEDLNEYELKEELLFNPEKDSKLGLHIYMIEKFDKSIKHFTEIAYKEVFRVLKKNFKVLPEILGLSGYAVSFESIHIASNLLSRIEIRPVNLHVFHNPRNELQVLAVKDQKEFDALLDKGYRLRNRCRLSAVTPNDPSIIWRWLKETL